MADNTRVALSDLDPMVAATLAATLSATLGAKEAGQFVAAFEQVLGELATRGGTHRMMQDAIDRTPSKAR